ncbi:Predicted arabinose efflux permease, MFS family [Microlunatus soli]|uniref:Predicted arabinose efflux permease, MFS family n=2 Tax=Microlunatus soli TaxID=630515 RepID=A0A1H1YVL5_9ACTN|nr:Predicted arabinose efflux permease, MFS family [Microlunatus soli]
MAGWVIGFGCSQLGDQIFALAIAWAAVQAGSAATVGLVIAAGSIPRIAILLFGGALADRLNAKLMIALADAARALTLIIFALLLMTDEPAVVALITVSVLIGTADGLFQPAIGALSVRLGPESEIGRISALRTTVSRLCLLIGGPISGAALAWWGTAAAFAIAGVLFIGSVASLVLIKIDRPAAASQPAAGNDSLIGEVVAGLRMVRRHPVLPWLLLMIGGLNFGFSGPMTAGIPLLADVLDWGPGAAGLIYGAFGLGAGTAGLSLVFVKRVPRAGWSALAAAAAVALALGAFALAAHPIAGIVAGAVLGVASGIFGTTANGLVMSSTPRSEIGRVMSLNALVLESVLPASLSLTGLLATLTSPSMTFAAGALVLLLTLLIPVSRRQVRAARL